MQRMMRHVSFKHCSDDTEFFDACILPAAPRASKAAPPVDVSDRRDDAGFRADPASFLLSN
jgi:hypothetical protein